MGFLSQMSTIPLKELELAIFKVKNYHNHYKAQVYIKFLIHIFFFWGKY